MIVSPHTCLFINLPHTMFLRIPLLHSLFILNPGGLYQEPMFSVDCLSSHVESHGLRTYGSQ
jgi:hypothetical protein